MPSRDAGIGHLSRSESSPSAAKRQECPNRPEWAMPGVPAIVGDGFCAHCSKVAGEWVKCEAEDA